MSDKMVWELSEEDFKEIQNIYEKEMALKNLKKIVDPNDAALCEKVEKDYQETVGLFRQWWRDKSAQYQWEGSDWYLDFLTQRIMARSN